MVQRVKVQLSEFLDIVKKENGLVLVKKGSMLMPQVCMIKSGDYYFYTVGGKKIDFPTDIKVQEVSEIVL
jgi:hypothetical protein